MAKLSVTIDTTAVLNRIIAAADIRNVAELARALDVSPQSLANIKGRGMVSLPFMLKAQEVAHKSLDFLISGHEYDSDAEDCGVAANNEESAAVSANDENNYIEVERIGGGTRNIRVLAELLRNGIDASTLKAYIEEGKLFLIDSADLVVTNGVFAFGDKMRPAIRKCTLQLDGTVLVESETKHLSSEDLSRYGIIGRVVLQQISV